METQDSFRELLGTDSVQKLIRRKAETLFYRAAIRGHDADDLAQELTVRIIPLVAQYRPERGPFEPFMAKVLENESVSLLRFFSAKKRWGGCQVSLHVVPAQGGGDELCELLSPNLDKRRAPPVLSPEEYSDITQDVRDVVGELPKRDRHLCRLAMRFSDSEISKLTGMPRSTVQSRLKALKKRFRSLENFDE